MKTPPFSWTKWQIGDLIHETPPFSWTKWQIGDLIHETPPFSWTKPPSPLHGMAQVRKNAEDLHQGKLLTN